MTERPPQYPDDGGPHDAERPANYPPQGGFPPPPGNYPPQGSYPPQGGYPPPHGNYPPQGGYPQPPAGTYGYQSFGPSDAGIPLGPSPDRLRVGAALSYAFGKFKANLGPWLGLSAIVWAVSVFAIVVIFTAALLAAVGAPERVETISTTTTSGIGLALSAISTLVSFFVNAVLVRGALDETGGPQKPSFGRFFQLTNVVQILILAIVLTVVSLAVELIPFVGTILLIFIGILTSFALTFLLDKNQTALESLKSSADLAIKNVGPLLLLLIVLVPINLAGILLCGLGLLVTIPVSILALNYAYRVFTGGPISPVL